MKSDLYFIKAFHKSAQMSVVTAIVTVSWESKTFWNS